jgi:hypothetical protein
MNLSPHHSLLEADDSLLVIIDVQDKFSVVLPMPARNA